jgi:hypothetical protein
MGSVTRNRVAGHPIGVHQLVSEVGRELSHGDCPRSPEARSAPRRPETDLTSQRGMSRHTAGLLDVPGRSVEQEMTQLRQRSGHSQFVSDLGHVAVCGVEPREPGTGQGLVSTHA